MPEELITPQDSCNTEVINSVKETYDAIRHNSEVMYLGALKAQTLEEAIFGPPDALTPSTVETTQRDYENCTNADQFEKLMSQVTVDPQQLEALNTALMEDGRLPMASQIIAHARIHGSCRATAVALAKEEYEPPVPMMVGTCSVADTVEPLPSIALPTCAQKQCQKL